jgi:dihydroorotase
MPESYLLRGGTVVHAQTTEDVDVLVRDGVIAGVGMSLDADASTTVLDASGCLVGPAFVDLHTHLREPGGEEAEMVASGARAGALGGYGALLAMPNTTPAADCAAVVAQILDLGRKSCLDVIVAGALTVGRAGERLAPMAEMAALGVTLFTDDGMGVQDAGLMRRVMEYARGLDVVVADHCEDESLAHGGSMNESSLSAELGLDGRPALAEEVMVSRDLMLAERTGVALHLLHLSTARSLDLVRAAKARGVQVTAEVTPHHVTLDESLCATYDPVYKVHPPLRTNDDIMALRAGLLDGSVDIVATDHAPHAPETKDRPFGEAPPGMLGLQHAAALTWAAMGSEVDPKRFFEVLARRPAEIVRLRAHDPRRGGQGAHGGDVVVGEDANLTVFDPRARTLVTMESLASKANNSPYVGMELTGAIRHTLVNGVGVVVDGDLIR